MESNKNQINTHHSIRYKTYIWLFRLHVIQTEKEATQTVTKNVKKDNSRNQNQNI